MQKHSNEYYVDNDIFPPRDGEEGIMYFRRLMVHLMYFIIDNYNVRLFQKLAANLIDQRIINILPKYDRRSVCQSIVWICLYHTIDHYSYFIEYFYLVCDSCLRKLYVHIIPMILSEDDT